MSEENKATLPEKREFQIDRPGHINLGGDMGHYPGCKLEWFPSVAAVNEFFRNNANLLTVDMSVDPVNGGVFVLYTNELDGEELEDFKEVQREVALAMEKRRKERRARREKEEENQKKASEDVKRLMELGKRCEEHHAPLQGRMKKLEQEIKKLRKENKE